MKRRKLIEFAVDLAALLGCGISALGLDRLGQKLGVDHSLALLWIGGILITAAVLIARTIAKQTKDTANK